MDVDQIVAWQAIYDAFADFLRGEDFQRAVYRGVRDAVTAQFEDDSLPAVVHRAVLDALG